MISLDKNILNINSGVAKRMIEYGKKEKLFIIIPNKKKITMGLSSTAHVQFTGGNKLQQFWRLKKLGEKLIRENSIDEITAQDPFFTGLVGFLLKKKFGIKLEVQMHGDFFGDYYKKQWFRLFLARFVIRHADGIRVVGSRVKQSLLNLGILENKIILRSVVVDKELIKNYQPKINLHRKYPEQEKIFLVLGRLDSVKNIPWLVEIFAEVAEQKNYLLLIVGSGREESKIKRRITKLKLEKNVKLENWINEPFDYIKTADCILFPSLSEGYGLVPLEASILGTPVIMNDVGVANYELKPGEKVKIIPIANRGAWKKTILEI